MVKKVSAVLLCVFLLTMATFYMFNYEWTPKAPLKAVHGPVIAGFWLLICLFVRFVYVKLRRK